MAPNDARWVLGEEFKTDALKPPETHLGGRKGAFLPLGGVSLEQGALPHMPLRVAWAKENLLHMVRLAFF